MRMRQVWYVWYVYQWYVYTQSHYPDSEPYGMYTNGMHTLSHIILILSHMACIPMRQAVFMAHTHKHTLLHMLRFSWLL